MQRHVIIDSFRDVNIDFNRLDERLRILQTGATIYPLKDYLGESQGPDRLWAKGEKAPGTFITRALGLECGFKAGVISQPEISVISYKKKMKFIVLASDGLWAVQDNEQVTNYLSQHFKQRNLEMGLSTLMEETVYRWSQKTELMDDISVLVIQFQQNNLK